MQRDYTVTAMDAPQIIACQNTGRGCMPRVRERTHGA